MIPVSSLGKLLQDAFVGTAFAGMDPADDYQSDNNSYKRGGENKRNGYSNHKYQNGIHTSLLLKCSNGPCGSQCLCIGRYHFKVVDGYLLTRETRLFAPKDRACFRSCVSSQVTHFNIPGISRRAGLHFLADGFASFAVGAHEFVVELKIHPHAGGDAEKCAEAQIVFGGAAAFALFHLGEVGRGNAAAAGDFRLGQVGFLKRFAEGLGEEVEQRDELRFLFHGSGSVIVCDLDVGGAAVFPAEHDAPLLVDADAPESLEIARE